MSQSRAERGKRLPPEDWYEAVRILPLDKDFRERRPFLAIVKPGGKKFRALAGGEVEQKFGLWMHHGGALNFVIKSPEEVQELNQLSNEVRRFSNFNPRQLNTRARQLRDQYRYAETFPFSVVEVKRREPTGHPSQSWFIGFRSVNGEALVRFRDGFLQRAELEEIAKEWYIARRRLQDPYTRLPMEDKLDILRNQRHTEDAFREVTGGAELREVEVFRYQLEDELRMFGRVEGLNTRTVKTKAELEEQDTYLTLGAPLLF